MGNTWLRDKRFCGEVDSEIKWLLKELVPDQDEEQTAIDIERDMDPHLEFIDQNYKVAKKVMIALLGTLYQCGRERDNTSVQALSDVVIKNRLQDDEAEKRWEDYTETMASLRTSVSGIIKTLENLKKDL